MIEEKGVFILRKGRLLVPEEHQSSITSHVILSTYSGNLWLFPGTRWENILLKLTIAEPSPEKDAALRIIALAVEAKMTEGCLPLPKSIQSRLAANPEVLLVGKLIGGIYCQD